MIRRSLVAPAILAAVLGAGRAAADEELFALSWVRGQGAESCPGAPALRAEVERRLGRKAFQDDADRSFEVLIQRSEAGYRAAIHIRTADGRALGTRELTSAEPTCDPLFHATALALALAIDPEARADDRPIGVASFTEPAAPGPEPAAESPPETTAEPEPAPPPAPELPIVTRTLPGTPEEPEENGTLRVAAGAALGVAILPSVTPGYALTASGEPVPRWGWEAGVVHLTSARHTAEGIEALVGLDLGWLAGQFLPITGETASLALGLGVAAGSLMVAVQSPDPLDVGEFFHVAVRGGARLDVRLGGPFIVELGAAAIVPLTLHRLNLAQGDGAALLWEMPPIGAIGTLGLGIVAL